MDNIWLLGYDTLFQVQSPKITMDFSQGSPSISSTNRVMNMMSTNALICSQNGNLLFYTNGVFIANANNDTMVNGEDLNPSNYTSQWSYFGLNITQADIILPFPNDSNKYYLFHYTADSIGFIPTYLYYTVVDMSLDGGMGAVISKNNVLLHAGFSVGGLTACKHANGRDWWLLSHEISTDRYFKFLVSPTGISTPFIQSIGKTVNNPGGGQQVFSPNGNYFANYDPILGLDIFDFDRCIGNFNNVIHMDFNDSAQYGGVAFSSNSKRLYVSSEKYLYQLDMDVGNIPGSKVIVATWDGYYSPHFPFASTFYLAQLASNGKIYINCQNSTVDMHIINQPDSIGISCDVCQHCLNLPIYNAFTIPNYPNFYLGAEGGTICDSLPTELSELNVYKGDKLKVFPNPIEGNQFYIEYPTLTSTSEAIIYNIAGEEVAHFSLPTWSNRQSVSLPQLNPGFYNLTITSMDKKISAVFIKQ